MFLSFILQFFHSLRAILVWRCWQQSCKGIVIILPMEPQSLDQRYMINFRDVLLADWCNPPYFLYMTTMALVGNNVWIVFCRFSLTFNCCSMWTILTFFLFSCFLLLFHVCIPTWQWDHFLLGFSSLKLLKWEHAHRVCALSSTQQHGTKMTSLMISCLVWSVKCFV